MKENCFIYRNGKDFRSLTFDFNEMSIHNQDGKRVYIHDANIQLFLELLIKAPEKGIEYKTVSESYGQKFNISQEDPKAVAARYKHKASAFLKSEFGLADFIKTATNNGYYIEPDWQIIENAPTELLRNDTIINELKALVNKSISRTNSSTIIKEANGVSYIRPSSSDAMVLFSEINELYWKILDQFPNHSKASTIISVRTELFKLATYIVYWRIGDDLEDEKWKSDYNDEITGILETIEHLYNRE